jgi:hypothetical protein
VTRKKGHRCKPVKAGIHDQIWTAVVTGGFMILADILQHLLAGWSLLGH